MGKEKGGCYKGPVGWLFLAYGVVWLLSDLGMIALDLPWLPLLVVLLALKKMFLMGKHCCK